MCFGLLPIIFTSRAGGYFPVSRVFRKEGIKNNYEWQRDILQGLVESSPLSGVSLGVLNMRLLVKSGGKKNLTTLLSCQGKEALSCFKQRSNVMQVLGRCEVSDQWTFRGIFTCITFEWALENFCVCGDSVLTLSHLEALLSITEGILLEYITQSHLRENVRIKIVRFGFRNI